MRRFSTSSDRCRCPPYITHELKDKNRYQTVYAKYEGSAAAPTAGLHFTQELLQQVRDMGVKIAEVTLHVGLGTFRPVEGGGCDRIIICIRNFIMVDETAGRNSLTRRRKNGGRVICVGTTSCRTIESAAARGWHADVRAAAGRRFSFIRAIGSRYWTA